MKQIALAFLFLTIAPILAHAQQTQCAPLGLQLMHLMVKFGERPLVVGATANGGKFMLLTNPDTGTWTILMVQAPDTACIGGAGDGLVTAQPSKPGAPT